MDEIPGYLSSYKGAIPSACCIFLLAGCLSQQEQKQPGTSASQNPTGAVAGITEQQDQLILPGPPSDLRLVVPASDSNLPYQLAWHGTRDDTISGYNIYKLDSPKKWSLIGFMSLRKEDSRNRMEYRFSKDIAASGTYAVAAVDSRGTPGPRSSEVHR